MIIAPYIKEASHDALLTQIIKDIDWLLNTKEDDFLLLCCGVPGSGKSMLMLQVLEEYLKEKASIDCVGLDKGDFANALKHAKEQELPRFCANDEANISKRDSMSKYNKNLIDLYLSIRGLRIFHWWNNPSLDMIDKHFIEERIKGVIYIATKDFNRPRIYYYFRKVDLLRIWDKYSNLKLKTIHKVRKKYSYYKGWFRDYEGSLKAVYLRKKNARMDCKVDDFFEKYGNKINTEFITAMAMKKILLVDKTTLRKYIEILKEQTILNNENFQVAPNGRLFFSKDTIPAFQRISKELMEQRISKLKKGVV